MPVHPTGQLALGPLGIKCTRITGLVGVVELMVVHFGGKVLRKFLQLLAPRKANASSHDVFQVDFISNSVPMKLGNPLDSLHRLWNEEAAYHNNCTHIGEYKTRTKHTYSPHRDNVRDVFKNLTLGQVTKTPHSFLLNADIFRALNYFNQSAKDPTNIKLRGLPINNSLTLFTIAAANVRQVPCTLHDHLGFVEHRRVDPVDDLQDSCINYLLRNLVGP